MEEWDLYNKDRKPLNKTIVRGVSKIKAGEEWHIAVMIITVNKKGEMLITFRSPEKPDYPSVWEITAGSAIKGEDSLTAAQRELFEETRIKVEKSEIKFLKSITEKTAFIDCYIVIKEFEISDIVFQKGETVDARKVYLSGLQELIDNGEFVAPCVRRIKELLSDGLLDEYLFTDEYYMSVSLQEAKKAEKIGEVPVGAIVVKSDTKEIVGSGYNKRETDKSPLAHAELIAIEEASKKLGGWRLIGCDLYCTLEPCVMCSGGIINSRIERVVYGADDLRFGAVKSKTQIFENDFNHKPEVKSGVLKEECENIIKDFFKTLRNNK